MVLYSKSTYGSQFSVEKKRFKNPMLGCREIPGKKCLDQYFAGDSVIHGPAGAL